MDITSSALGWPLPQSCAVAFICPFPGCMHACMLSHFSHSVIPILRPHGLSSPPDFSVHGILQARILKWSAMPFAVDLPDPRIKPMPLCLLHWHPSSSPLVSPGTYFLGEDIDTFRVRAAPRNRRCRWDSEPCLASSSAVRGSVNNWGPCRCPKSQEGPSELQWSPDLSLSRRPPPLERVVRWDPLGQAVWDRAKTLGGIFVASMGFGEACTCGRCGWVGQGPWLWRRGEGFLLMESYRLCPSYHPWELPRPC